jgi:HD-like signal output (HDOD) protein/CheY-like chemotaxis protein
MKRILFVDDDLNVLKGLERSLYKMSREWEMEFVDSGARALNVMARKPFDVVVADMRMPVMNGAELLNQVMQNYPRTVRLILSGHADNDMVLKCVGSTHQYLSKPCDPDMLRQTIERAAALERTLESQTLRQLVSQMQRLPSLPSLYIEIVEKIKSPEVPLQDIAAIVAKDIGMTAQLLKLVNSAFFGLSQEISSAEAAVSYLGIDTIKSLVLSIHTFSRFNAIHIPGFSIDELWRHSMSTATAARAIALTQERNSKVADEAFSAGMLHDTGKLVLAGNFPAEYAEVLRLVDTQSLPLLIAERRVVGATHADVGGYLLGLWGLPVPVVEAIMLHHQPGLCPVKTFSPLTAVHVGDFLARENTSSGLPAPEAGLDMGYLESCGSAKCLDRWRAVVQDALDKEQNQ